MFDLQPSCSTDWVDSPFSLAHFAQMGCRWSSNKHRKILRNHTNMNGRVMHLGDLLANRRAPPPSVTSAPAGWCTHRRSAQVLRSRNDGKKPAEIRPYLFLGGTATAESAETMQQMGITHILNVAGSIMQTVHQHFPACFLTCCKNACAYPHTAQYSAVGS